MVIDTILTFGFGWLLGRGIGNGKKAPPSSSTTPASTPSSVQWPTSEERPLTPEEKAKLQQTVDVYTQKSKPAPMPTAAQQAKHGGPPVTHKVPPPDMGTDEEALLRSLQK